MILRNLNLLQKKWYVIDSQTAKDKYNPNNSIDYSDAFILVILKHKISCSIEVSK